MTQINDPQIKKLPLTAMHNQVEVAAAGVRTTTHVATLGEFHHHKQGELAPMVHDAAPNQFHHHKIASNSDVPAID
jgi:hypothetical protein